MAIRYLLIFSAICWHVAIQLPLEYADDGPIVQTNQGQVLGTVKSTPKGKIFYAFLGLPYAKPPLGDLRYKAPVPGDPWDGILDGTQEPDKCLQVNFTEPLSAQGSEDCLTLSVYSPSLPSGGETALQLPVHVFIHGGGFFEGEIITDHYGPERFLDHSDMIIVYMNYRLASIGFLSTGDAAASGNYGLLDQSMALQWVKTNIAAFGGNPDNVTLSGQSAGSASVLFHILSPVSSGLFQRAIAESGSALCPWAVEENPLYFAQRLAEQLGCPTDDTQSLVDCLKVADGEEIAIKGAAIMLENLTLAYVPVVENADTGLFLTEDPLTLLQEGRFNQVPLIAGINRDEGVLIYEFIFWMCKIIDDQFFNEVVPFFLTVLTDYRTNLLNVSYAIKDEYYNIDLTNSSAVTRASIDMLSDMFMKSWVVQTINLISAQDVPVYMYAYNYVGDFYWTNFTGGADVTHSIELAYLYNMTLEQPLTSKDTAFSDKLVPLWANFITQGNPTPSGSPQWTTTPTAETVYYNIDDEFALLQGYQVERMQFWNEIVPAIVSG